MALDINAIRGRLNKLQNTQKKTTEIRQRTQYIRQYVDREVVRYDAGCVIPQPFVQAHNDAAEAPKK